MSKPLRIMAAGLLLVFMVPLSGVRASAESSVSLRGSITLEPVLLPYCAPGAVCPAFKKTFLYPYRLSIYERLGGIEWPVMNKVPEQGPASVQIKLLPGTYDIRFHAGTLGVEYPQPITISPGASAGTLLLHFIAPADGSGYFRDYNGCVYDLGSQPAPTNCRAG